MKLTFEQEVKLQLVALAEYLQVKDGLSDMQIKMYAADLAELGSVGLSTAIALLKEDPEVWSGRFPLPAKLKQYVRGDVTALAHTAANKIMSMNSVREAYDKLEAWELQVAREYGINSIVSRLAEQSPTIFSQLRELIKTRLKAERNAGVQIGHDRRNDTVALIAASASQEGAAPHGEE